MTNINVQPIHEVKVSLVLVYRTIEKLKVLYNENKIKTEKQLNSPESVKAVRWMGGVYYEKDLRKN